MAADFTVRKDNRGQFYWTFQAENNEVLARSSESYVKRSDCLHSIYLVRTLSSKVPVWEGLADGTFTNVASQLK